MATYIKTIEDANGDIIAPRTRAEAVTLDDGTTNLLEVLEGYDDAIADVEDTVEALEITVEARASTGKAIAMAIVFG